MPRRSLAPKNSEVRVSDTDRDLGSAVISLFLPPTNVEGILTYVFAGHMQLESGESSISGTTSFIRSASGNPKKFIYTTELCPQRGKCASGDLCRLAHTKEDHVLDGK